MSDADLELCLRQLRDVAQHALVQVEAHRSTPSGSGRNSQRDIRQLALETKQRLMPAMTHCLEVCATVNSNPLLHHPQLSKVLLDYLTLEDICTFRFSSTSVVDVVDHYAYDALEEHLKDFYNTDHSEEFEDAEDSEEKAETESKSSRTQSSRSSDAGGPGEYHRLRELRTERNRACLLTRFLRNEFTWRERLLQLVVDVCLSEVEKRRLRDDHQIDLTDNLQLLSGANDVTFIVFVPCAQAISMGRVLLAPPCLTEASLPAFASLRSFSQVIACLVPWGRKCNFALKELTAACAEKSVLVAGTTSLTAIPSDFFENVESFAFLGSLNSVRTIGDCFLARQCITQPIPKMPSLEKIGKCFLLASSVPHGSALDLTCIRNVVTIGPEFLQCFSQPGLPIDLSPLLHLKAIPDACLRDARTSGVILDHVGSQAEGDKLCIGSLFCYSLSGIRELSTDKWCSALRTISAAFLCDSPHLTSVTIANLPMLLTIGRNFLSHNPSLETVVFRALPGLSIIEENGLVSCRKLSLLDVSGLTGVVSYPDSMHVANLPSKCSIITWNKETGEKASPAVMKGYVLSENVSDFGKKRW